MRIDYSVTGDTNSTYATDTEAGLEIKLNRSEYSDGEQIQMQISAPYSGYGLITIEREKRMHTNGSNPRLRPRRRKLNCRRNRGERLC